MDLHCVAYGMSAQPYYLPWARGNWFVDLVQASKVLVYHYIDDVMLTSDSLLALEKTAPSLPIHLRQ